MMAHADARAADLGHPRFAAIHLVDADEPELLAAALQRDGAIDDESDAARFELALYLVCARPVVVIAEDGEEAVAGGESCRQDFGCQRNVTPPRNEVAAEDDDVGIERARLRDDVLEMRASDEWRDVCVGDERDAVTVERCREIVDEDGVPR